MLTQANLNYSDYFYSEFMLVEYFVILILSIELAGFFIYQYFKRKGLSPKWILSFSVVMIGFTVVYFLRDLYDLAFEDAMTMILFNKIDLMVISACSIATSYFMLDFFKRNRTLARVLSFGCLILGFISLFMNIYALFSPWDLQLFVTTISMLAFLVIVVFPMYLLDQLTKRDPTFKKFFWLIFTGVFVISAGLIFNFKNFEDEIKILASNMYIAYKIGILLMIIGGFTMLGLSAFYLPPLDDFLWIDSLVALYVIGTSNQKVLFRKIFNLEAITAMPFASNQEGSVNISEDTFLGGISGITDILSEALIDPSKKVEFVDQGTIKILLTHESNLIFIILVTQTVPILSWKLRQFKDAFMMFYGDLVKKFENEPEKFLPVDKLATQVFNVGSKSRNPKVNQK